MRFALVQQDIVWGDPEANCAHLDTLLQDIVPGALDVVVLPEMCSTGFVTDNPEFAETGDGRTLGWMKRKSSDLDCAIAGSVAVRLGGGECRNRLYFVKPDGEVTFYDKRHLFTYGGEDRTFSAGHKRAVVEWRGVRMLLAVCYDIRFPVWLRGRGDYDGIIVVANWPDCRRLAWDTLKVARAIENQCFVAAVNRVGSDPVCTYDGGTAFVSAYGEVTASASDGRECVVFADFDMDTLDSYRAKFPVTLDADNFELI